MRSVSFVLSVALVLVASSASAQKSSTLPVNISSTPPGATVYVDSTGATPLGVTPMKKVRVPRGSHKLIFQLVGHEEAQLAVDIRKWGESFKATLTPLGVIVVNVGGDSAVGAVARIDGESVGKIPVRKTVRPGRHLVQVGKRGFATLSQWVDVLGGQVLTIPAVLESQQAGVGSLLVTADVTGVPVYIDGKQRGGTPLVVEGLTAGEHLVEVRPKGQGYKPFSKVVTIVATKRATVEAKLQGAADTGSLRIIANVPSALITLDGADIGVAPAAKAGLKPGQHIVLARAEGYEPVQQTVEVVAGRERVVSLRLESSAAENGKIVVHANLPEATVSIDGQDYGTVPVVLEAVETGTHTIVVRASGYREVRRTCRVDLGRNCELNAELFAMGVPVRVEANVAGELFVDDDRVGPVPWEGDLPAGSHEIEIRAEGFRSHLEQIRLVESSQVRLIQVRLAREGDVSSEEREGRREAKRRKFRETVSHAGAPLPVGMTTLDMSLGWPYLGELRFSTGITDYLDAGIAVRTSGRLTDFEARTRVGWRFRNQFSAGAQLRLGGGIGPARADSLAASHKTNSFFVGIDAIGSLHLGEAGAFSIIFGMDVHSDRWDFAGNDKDFAIAGIGRQKLARARLGGALDLVLTKRWNLFFIIEGILTTKRRRVLGDLFGAGKDDSRIYGRAGFTYKFGSLENVR